jgi:hypothetical protein
MSLKLGVSHWERNIMNGSENRLLRWIFGPEGEEVAGDWR